MTDPITAEQTVAHYLAQQNVTLNRQVAQQAHAMLNDLLAMVQPGMSESTMAQQAEAYFQQQSVLDKWHRPYIRFGPNTRHSYYHTAKTADYVLQAHDIAYLDIGPVIKGVEGDAGRTVVLGCNPAYQAIRQASQQLFDDGSAYWRQHNPTGQALYAILCQQAQTMGYTLDLDPAGHMIGSFPHQGWKKGINHYPGTLAAGIWILEIHLLSPCRQFGAFYEHILA
jgi:Xaa-Pro aminopeptidase